MGTFSITNIVNLSAELGASLRTRGLMLATAESCTGGLLSAMLTEVPGSSAYFERGFVTYSNASKTEMLGVKAETLEKFGAISEETAREMALGAIKHSHAHIAVSITGIAGPDGGTPEKPVGTVCFGIAMKDAPATSITKKLSGNRQQIRHLSVETALLELLKLLARR